MDRRTFLKAAHAFVSVAFCGFTGLLLASKPSDDSKPTDKVFPTSTVMVDADLRQHVSLDGDWHVIVDPYGMGYPPASKPTESSGFAKDDHWKVVGDNHLVEYDFTRSSSLRVPGDWNTQRESLFLYEGTIWYQRPFHWQPSKGRRTFLHIGAANYLSRFWVNGALVCEHEGGFTSFDCEVTQQLRRGENSIVAAVDNRRTAEGVPALQTDWWNYGGLTRSVSLFETPASCIRSYYVRLNRETRSTIEGTVYVDGAVPGQQVVLDITELGIHAEVATDNAGVAKFSVTPSRPIVPWSPAIPKLYRVDLISGGDSISDRIGFRSIETRGNQIFLNGHSIFLKGVSIHAEAPFKTGRPTTRGDDLRLLRWAEELGCNYVRLAHYPHDAQITRLADELGLMVWSEIPVYWNILFNSPAVEEKAKAQLREEIGRDQNRASIVVWSIANETPNNRDRNRFLRDLAQTARSLDSDRLISAALLVKTPKAGLKMVDDPLGEVLDVIGINEYIGWYEGKPGDAQRTVWKFALNKPVIVSEFGGDAKMGPPWQI